MLSSGCQPEASRPVIHLRLLKALHGKPFFEMGDLLESIFLKPW